MRHNSNRSSTRISDTSKSSNVSSSSYGEGAASIVSSSSEMMYRRGTRDKISTRSRTSNGSTTSDDRSYNDVNYRPRQSITNSYRPEQQIMERDEEEDDNYCIGENSGNENINSNDNDNNDDDEDDSDDDNEEDDDDEDEDARNRSTMAMLAGGIDRSVGSSNKPSSSSNGTIALFGVYSRTGNHFLRLALDAGYSVRVFLLPTTTIIDPTTKRKKAICASALQDEFSATEQTLKWIPAKRFDDKTAMQKTISNVDYVVCMLSDTVYTDADNSSVPSSRRTSGSFGSANVVNTKTKKRGNRKVGILTNFIQTLYPLMKEIPSIQVFLYQATSLAPNVVNGSTPMLSQFFKSFAQVTTGSKTATFLQDQDAVTNEIALHHHYYQYPLSVVALQKPDSQDTSKTTKQPAKFIKAKVESAAEGNDEESENNQENDSHDGNGENADTTSCSLMTNKQTLEPPKFSYIITRPTSLINDGPSSKKLAATKSQPGPFPITHVDLAEFSLNALLRKKLYNTCPYVIPDN